MAAHEEKHSTSPLLADVLRKNPDFIQQLALCLDREMRLIGNWKHLSLELKVDANVITRLEQHSDFSPTIRLFEYLEVTQPDLTIQQLKQALSEIKRNDLVRLLTTKAGCVDSEMVKEVITSPNVVAPRVSLLDDIALALDERSMVLGNWSNLALRLGVPRKPLKQFERRSTQSPTYRLFEYLEVTHPQMTLKILKDALELMNRKDLLNILRDQKLEDEVLIKDAVIPGSELFQTVEDKLNIDYVSFAQNWCQLAHHLKIPPHVYREFDDGSTAERKSPTKEVLQLLVQRTPDLTLIDVIEALGKIQRNDAIQIITQRFPDAVEKLREDLGRMEIGMENISKKLDTFAIPGEELKDEENVTQGLKPMEIEIKVGNVNEKPDTSAIPGEESKDEENVTQDLKPMEIEIKLGNVNEKPDTSAIPGEESKDEEKLREDLAPMVIGMENISEKPDTLAIPAEELKDEENVTQDLKPMEIEIKLGNVNEKPDTSAIPGEESKDEGVLPVSTEGRSSWMDTYITSNIITSEGGEVAGKGVKLVCPPGAVNKPVTITLSLEDPAKHYGRIVEKDLENDVMIAAPVINLQPNGLLFKKPVTLITNFEMKDFNREDVFILEGTEDRDGKIVWKDITLDSKLSMLDDKSAEVIIEMEHFTLYEIVKSKSLKEFATKLNLRGFNYTISALHNKNSMHEQLALLFVSQDVYHQQSYKENEASALVQLQNDGFTELHVRSTNVQEEEKRVYNNEKLHISIHLEEDYNLDDSEQETVSITVNSHNWWNAGEVRTLRLKYTEDARILCGKIRIKREDGHTSERHFSETDICGYVRSLLGVEKAIYNLMPIAAKLLETPDQAKNEILKSWKDDDAQLETILKHRFNKDDLAIKDLAALREDLEGLRKKGLYRVTQRGQMYIRYLRQFASKILAVQCMHDDLMKSFSNGIQTVCKKILRDCCIELEDSAESVEKEASFTTHVEYLKIRKVDIAEKYQEICSSPGKSIPTFKTNVPYLIQSIKEIFVDATISQAQNGLNGLPEETLEQLESNVLRAVENNKLQKLSVDVVCEILYQLCLSNCGNRPTTEIEMWNESLSILTMLEFLKQFFQHCPQDVRLYKRLELFIGRLRDIISGRVDDEFSMLDYCNVSRSLIHFAKFDASKMVTFELRDSKSSPVSSASGDIQYDKNHKTFSQQFFIKNETEGELQLHAFARVHVDGHVQEKGGPSIKLVGRKHVSLRLLYVWGMDEVTFESDVSENLANSSDNGASIQGEPVPRKDENSAGSSVQDPVLRNAQPTAGTSAEKSCEAMRLKRTFSASCSMSTPKRTKLTASKEDQPSEDELEELSGLLGLSWEALARRLGFHKGEIDGFDKDNEKLPKKAYYMLIRWKEKGGVAATYSVLYDALCHRFVQRKDLAEMFCCN